MVLLGLPGGFELKMVPLGAVLGLAKHLLRSRVLFGSVFFIGSFEILDGRLLTRPAFFIY